MPDLSVISNSPLELDLLQVCLRLACAMAVGLVIGTEREYTHRPAGMRTHILVALGACVVTITGQLIFAQYSAYGSNPDPARLSAQIITGVGFLGAGTILREGATVRGLTTAASVWAVACLGIAAGFGYYLLAIAGMVFIFITLTIFEVIQNKLPGTHVVMQFYRVSCTDLVSALDAIHSCAASCGATTRDLTVKHLEDGSYSICFHLERKAKPKKADAFLAQLASDPAISAVQVLSDQVSAAK